MSVFHSKVKSCTFRGFDCMGMGEDTFDHEVHLRKCVASCICCAVYILHQVVLNPVYGNCYNFYLVDPDIGSIFAPRSFITPITRPVLYVWSQLWALLGLKHRAKRLPERRPGEENSVCGWSLKPLTCNCRPLPWVPGCRCRKGTPTRWSVTSFLFFSLNHLTRSGGWVWDGLGPWTVDKHLHTAGESQFKENLKQKKIAKIT